MKYKLLLFLIGVIALVTIVVLITNTRGSNARGPTALLGSAPGDGSDAILSCVPSDGVWSVDDPEAPRGKRLNSPCCQAPDYKILDPRYKTCANYSSESDASIQKCLADCCKNASAEKDRYDPSWYPMAQCGCSLWCYNSKVPHFAKHGTAVHYIEGDIAEVNTPDTAPVGKDWRGWIDFTN